MKTPTPPFRLGSQEIERRDLLKLMALGGVVSASGLIGCASRAPAAAAGAAAPSSPVASNATDASAPRDFVFLQLSDTHWGYKGANNPLADVTLERAVREINASPLEPDFVVFTGDLTHTTEDAAVRRARLKEFKNIVSELKVKARYFLPGEHDAGPDGGEAYREAFGETHSAFDHEGVHFVLLDNVSLPGSILGDAQLEWLAHDVLSLKAETPLVVFAHRPLFDLYPSWDWSTRDGARALEILSRHANASVFYGHIHQQHHQKTGNIEHHAARSLIFPLPAPGSVEKKAPLAWNAESVEHGIGYRDVSEHGGQPEISDVNLALAEGAGAGR